MSVLTIGTIHTIGYVQKGAAAHVARLMTNERTILLDIRYSPGSRWFPEWTRRSLAARYGEHYLWDQRLGNRNYRQREQGIELADGHLLAARAAASLLAQGTSLILLCACKDEQTCHRRLVAKLIQDELGVLLQKEVCP